MVESAYRQVLRQPALRRVLPGVAVSSLGDGMTMVAVAWLAVQIAPGGQAAVWTGLAVAAYSLPATVGAALAGRLVRRFSGAQLVAADAILRAGTLGIVAVLAVTDQLAPAGYVLLLALSSLLHAWGSAGVYTLIAEVLPDGGRLAGNALVATFQQAAFVIGPALAGAVAAVFGPGWVIAIDAASFAVLALCCRGVQGRPAPPAASTGGGWRIIVARPQLLGLLVVTCVFYFLYGPVEVALPIYVAQDLHGSAALLGAYWTAFGVGAVVGGLCAGLLRDRPLPVVLAAVIIGWGAALLPLALTHAVWAGLVGLAVGGLVYGPFTALCVALFQQASPAQMVSRVLATRTALTIPATALGVLAGGPAVAALGAQSTLLWSALLTMALGAAVALAHRLSV